MAHTVRDWTSSPVVVIPHEMPASLALTLMRRRGVHSLVVDLTKDEPAYGILTTTDVREKIAGQDRDPAAHIFIAPAGAGWQAGS
jgi:CBS domain containing-hemolysin-like protein